MATVKIIKASKSEKDAKPAKETKKVAPAKDVKATKAAAPAKDTKATKATPAKAEAKAAPSKTVYHVSKREGKEGREWKVFIEGSTKVIKLCDTQKEALDYAQSLCKNKDDGSYVLLHGLDGKIRKI